MGQERVVIEYGVNNSNLALGTKENHENINSGTQCLTRVSNQTFPE